MLKLDWKKGLRFFSTGFNFLSLKGTVNMKTQSHLVLSNEHLECSSWTQALSLPKPHWPISWLNSSCSCPPESKDSFFRPQIKCQVLIKPFMTQRNFIKGPQTLCFSLLWHLPHFHLIFLGIIILTSYPIGCFNY